VKIFTKNGDLCFDAGFFQGVTKVPLAKLRQWTVCREENAATYLAFALDGCTQHVPFPFFDTSAILSTLKQIESFTGMAPRFEIEKSFGKEGPLDADLVDVYTVEAIADLLGIKF
jgi:hypothetical protein